MKIVQALGWYFPDSLGGTEVYVAALAERLRRLGHQVIVAAPDPAHTVERHDEHEGARIYRYPIAATVSRDQARGFAVVPGAERFHHWLARERPDVVHVHTFVTGLGLRELASARAAGARVIVTSHAASLGFLCERGTLMRYGRALCDALVEPVTCATCALEHRGVPMPVAALAARIPVRLSLRALAWRRRAGTGLGMRALIDANRASQARLFDLADRVVVLSQWAADALRANGAPADKVVVNRLGIACRTRGWPRKPPPAERPTRLPLTAGFAGRVERIKGLADAITAVRSLPGETPVRLRVVALARTPDDQRELARCRRLAAGDARIVFEPAVPPRDMPALLASFDVLLCPSRAIEGGPTVALEAMAVGTPVLAAAVPALTEIVQPDVTGWLHAPADVRALAGALARLAAEPSRIDQCRARLGPVRTMDEVARDYEREYGRQWTPS